MDFEKDMQEMATALQVMLQKRQSISDMDASLLTLMKGQMSVNQKLLEELKKTNQRLTKLGHDSGIVGSERAETFAAKLDRLDVSRETMSSLNLTPNEAAKHGLTVRLDGVRRTALDLLSLTDFASLARIWPELGSLQPGIVEQLEIDAQYAGYLNRQDIDIKSFRQDEGMLLPP